MATLPSFTQFWSLPRWHTDWPAFTAINFVQVPNVRLHSRFVVRARPRRKLTDDTSDVEEADSEKKTTRRRTPSRRRKKEVPETPEENLLSEVSGNGLDEEKLSSSGSVEVPEKPQRQSRRKVTSTSSSLDEEEPEKKVTRRRRTKKKIDDTVDQDNETELSDYDDNTDDERELEFDTNAGEDVSSSYLWPPLVCCFGSVQHAFVPSGRQANRIVDHEAQERMKDALWIPEKFVRAPGGCAGDVALALSILGSNVAMMGKIGNDDWGQALLYHLNVNNVQTRSIRIDSRRTTAVSQMKVSKRGGLRMNCLKPCAEDTLQKSEINIDVLREAKIFYFNSFSLLDRKMRSSALQAVTISKKLGGVIFYDLNLPLPLWQSREETKTFIQEAWDLADIIEVTKQELEFLCGIVPSEKFNTKDNDRTKFVHYSPEVISPIFHDNLKVLFVTNGTSKIHYYTKEHNGSVLGMEEPPITPFTSDMSASGDGIVAALMNRLVAQLHLITDKEYLEHSIKYAINRAVEAQWFQARTLGYPPKEGMEEDPAKEGMEEDSPKEGQEEDEDDFFNSYGIKTITEEEYRTLVPVRKGMDEDNTKTIAEREYRPLVPIREGTELVRLEEDEDEDNIFFDSNGIKIVTEEELMRVGSLHSSS